MRRLFDRKHSLIIALDTPYLKEINELVERTCDLDVVGGYKVSGRMASLEGLRSTIKAIGERTSKPKILDLQKGGSDAPFIERQSISEIVAPLEIDAYIIFPFGGRKTLEAAIEACEKHGIVLIVGGLMSQFGFLKEEGGFISRRSAFDIYKKAAELGVEYFVAPGNRPLELSYIVALTSEILVKEGMEPKYCIPGIGMQGGDISSAIKACKHYSAHPIVGRAIREALDPRAAAIELAREFPA